MCTVTWLEHDGGYHLFSNRDELKSRGKALPPRLCRSGESVFLAPIDADAGGSWVAVNDRGLGLTLLNDYESEQGEGAFESRGGLVVGLATVASTGEALERLGDSDLERFRPFRLLLVGLDEPARVRHWDGRRLASECPSDPALLTSSSFDPLRADEARRVLLRPSAGARLNVEELRAFHRSHWPERGPFSPCMHRDDAHTVSFTWLEVTRERAVMRYRDGPPCGAEPDQELSLDLALERLQPSAGV